MKSELIKEPPLDYFNSWIPHLKESKIHRDVFTAEDRQWLINHMFRRHHKTDFKDSGTTIFSLYNRHHEIVEKFEDKIRAMVPDFSTDYYMGNYYIGCHPYSIHTDSCMEDEMTALDFKVIPYRQLIIPLNVSPLKCAGEKTGIVTFKQRYLNYGTIFCQGQIPDSVKGSMPGIYSHKGIEFYTFERGHELYDDNKLFDPIFYKKYLDNLPYTNLNNLEVENILPYELGSCIEIDACQLHTSVNFRKHGGMHKIGLAFNLFKKV